MLFTAYLLDIDNRLISHVFGKSQIGFKIKLLIYKGNFNYGEKISKKTDPLPTLGSRRHRLRSTQSYPQKMWITNEIDFARFSCCCGTAKVSV